ncbi:hypothetical protein OROGR_003780 [Orobanche gracilis]
MATGSKKKVTKSYASSSKRAREPQFVEDRFVSSQASKVFLEILPQEQVTDCYYFNINSLERARLDVKEFFEDLSVEKFIACKEPIFPNLVGSLMLIYMSLKRIFSPHMFWVVRLEELILRYPLKSFSNCLSFLTKDTPA